MVKKLFKNRSTETKYISKIKVAQFCGSLCTCTCR